MKRLLGFFLILAGCRVEAQTPPFSASEGHPEFQELQAASLYVPMRDGVRIAIDDLLPKGLPARRNRAVPHRSLAASRFPISMIWWTGPCANRGRTAP